MKKKEKWMKFRHRVAWVILYPILAAITLIKFPIHVKPLNDHRNRPYLILFNHQTPFDQFFVALAFKGPIYFISTEDILSNGLVSKVIKWLLAPIPIKKQTSDLRAVRNAMQVAKEGGSIALAPEGNRTFHGKTVYMNPAIASLAKKLALPIAFFRIEGGYGIQPRWSDVVRGGPMRRYISRVMEPEEYAEMTKEQLAEVIRQELFVDEVQNGISGLVLPAGRSAQRGYFTQKHSDSSHPASIWHTVSHSRRA